MEGHSCCATRFFLKSLFQAHEIFLHQSLFYQFFQNISQILKINIVQNYFCLLFQQKLAVGLIWCVELQLFRFQKYFILSEPSSSDGETKTQLFFSLFKNIIFKEIKFKNSTLIKSMKQGPIDLFIDTCQLTVMNIGLFVGCKGLGIWPTQIKCTSC